MTTMTTGRSEPVDLCLPRFGTLRNPDRPTFGPEVGEVARRLGKPLMPWQQYVADVVYEHDGNGRLFYSEVDLTVPRQSGKTTLLLAVMAHRSVVAARRWGRQNTVYTAQTRNAAHRKWEAEHLEVLRASRSFREAKSARATLRKPTEFRVRLQRGDEHILFGTGSRWGIDAPSRDAGHGDTLDVGVIDEAFSHQTDDVEQAMRPAQATRWSPQLWVLSTAGDDKSPYLYGKVLAGRRAVAAGADSGVAYFEWSIPDGADIDDEAVWWEHMPALGRTIDVAFIRGELERARRSEEGEGLWLRGYGNRWVKTPTLGEVTFAVIPAEVWKRSHRPDVDPAGRVRLAVDMNPERSAVAIGLAGRSPDGHPVVDLVEHGGPDEQGFGWVVDRLVSMRAMLAGPVVVDPSSPAGSLIKSLEAAGLEVATVTVGDQGRACGQLFSALAAEQPGVWHIDQDPTSASLDAAVRGARKRKLVDAWAWSRSDSAVDVCPLVAITLAFGSLLDADADAGPVFAY